MPESEYRTFPDLYLSAWAPLFGRMRKIATPQGFWRIHGENNSWRQGFDDRLRATLQRLDHCFEVVSKYCQSRGIYIDQELWKAKSWSHRIHRATQEIASVVPSAATFVLADEDQWGADEFVAGRRRLPFLERDGQYWGPPPDDQTAIQELERLRRAGTGFMVFAWPAFWWLEHYSGLHQYLRSGFHCVLENDRLVVFYLKIEFGI
jgi:hypothetical protein